MALPAEFSLRSDLEGLTARPEAQGYGKKRRQRTGNHTTRAIGAACRNMAALIQIKSWLAMLGAMLWGNKLGSLK